MSADRRIFLDMGLPNLGTSLGPGTGDARARPEADSDAVGQFEQAMADKAAPGAAPGPQVPAAPLSMFSARIADPAAAPADPSLARRVSESVERLMVGDGSSGNKQVRIELKDELLPGVSLTVQELEGRLQVDFFCAVEESRLRLNAAAPGQARELAQRLARDVLVRVQSDDDEDPCLLEALASP